MTDVAGLAETPAQTGASESDAAPDPIEALAAAFGHKPKTDDWQGEWEDPATFLAKQPDRIKALKEKAAQAAEAAKRATRTAETALKKAREGDEKRLAERIKAAVAAGDEVAAEEATTELIESRANTPDPTITAFIAANPWFDDHDEARAIAIAVSNRLGAQGKTVTEQCEAAEARVRKVFPDLFEDDDEPAPRPKKGPPAVTTGTRTVSQPREKGIADVPANIKAAWTPKYCKMFDTNQAELAKLYHEGNA